MTRAADICSECRRPLNVTADGQHICTSRLCGEYGRSVDLQLSLDLEPSEYLNYENERARLRGAA
jgi:hypothetical protein